jgi:hypothetical protein
MQQEPSFGALLALCLVGASGLIFLFWLNHKIRTRGQHKRAPEVRRRVPIRVAPLRSEAAAPGAVRRTVARVVRTAENARTAFAQGAAGVQTGADVQGTPDSDLPHSPEELYQLGQIILHKQRGRSKADAIRDVTGVSKGGNPKYQRWSRMVDLATEPTSRYRVYTPEEQAVLQSNGHAE